MFCSIKWRYNLPYIRRDLREKKPPITNKPTGYRPPNLSRTLFYMAVKWYLCHVIWFMQPWWRHQIETFSALLAICAGNSPVTSEFHAQRPVTRSFDAFFDLRLNKRLSKQSWGWWFETLSRPLWRHSNVYCHCRVIMVAGGGQTPVLHQGIWNYRVDVGFWSHMSKIPPWSDQVMVYLQDNLWWPN